MDESMPRVMTIKINFRERGNAENPL